MRISAILVVVLWSAAAMAHAWRRSDEILARRGATFIHTAELAHNDVVSNRNYFSLFLSTGAVVARQR